MLRLGLRSPLTAATKRRHSLRASIFRFSVEVENKCASLGEPHDQSVQDALGANRGSHITQLCQKRIK